MVKKLFSVLVLLPAFLIVLAHNILPAHHHVASAEHHHHDNASHYHHDHHHSVWDNVIGLLEKIPHPDTDNQAQQVFVKHIIKQESTFSISSIAIISENNFEYNTAQTAFISFIDKEDPLEERKCFNSASLRAPPVFS